MQQFQKNRRFTAAFKSTKISLPLYKTKLRTKETFNYHYSASSNLGVHTVPKVFLPIIRVTVEITLL